MSQTARLLREVYDRLYDRYGPQHWWPGDTAFEMIVGAILTQSAAWTNVRRALDNLQAAGALSPAGLRRTGEAELAQLVRPSGYFNAKARKLKAFIGLLYERFGGDLDALLAAPDLREQLLATHGIGPETADSIVLYAARRPAFVIDAYARRTFSRIGLHPQRDTYDAWQAMFTEALPPDAALFNEYHALIVAHGKDACRSVPRCGSCVLRSLCETGRLRAIRSH